MMQVTLDGTLRSSLELARRWFALTCDLAVKYINSASSASPNNLTQFLFPLRLRSKK
jgi:hypothetical protein